MVNKKRLLKLIPLITAMFIYLFLSGNIIEISNGTHEAGVIGAIGVTIIGTIGIVSVLIVKKYYPEKNKTS